MAETLERMEGEVTYSGNLDHKNMMPFFKRALDWYRKYNQMNNVEYKVEERN